MAQELLQLSKVKEFLDSKARKSKNTAYTYETGLKWLNKYIELTYPTDSIETITLKFNPPEPKDKDTPKAEPLDIYKFFNSYVSYLLTPEFELSTASIHNFIYCAKSFFGFHDIDISHNRFKSRVVLPANRKEDEYPVDISEIRMILGKAHNRRLRAFLFLEGSTGARPVEACAIRYRDVDYSHQPTKIYMRAEWSKNKLPREVYLTSEATEELKQWDAYKLKGNIPNPDELVFAYDEHVIDPYNIYLRVSELFRDVLRSLGMDEMKDKRRRKITLYSFRRFVETTIEDHSSANFADYILGHKKSPYYAKKENERAELYADQCENELIYLDYSKVENAKKMVEKERDAAMVKMHELVEHHEKAYFDVLQELKSIKATISSGGVPGA